jgi:hypothetical protein
MERSEKRKKDANGKHRSKSRKTAVPSAAGSRSSKADGKIRRAACQLCDYEWEGSNPYTEVTRHFSVIHNCTRDDVASGRITRKIWEAGLWPLPLSSATAAAMDFDVVTGRVVQVEVQGSARTSSSLPVTPARDFALAAEVSRTEPVASTSALGPSEVLAAAALALDEEMSDAPTLAFSGPAKLSNISMPLVTASPSADEYFFGNFEKVK